MRQVKFYRHAELVILGRELTARIKCAGQGKERHSNGDNRLRKVCAKLAEWKITRPKSRPAEISRADYSAENQCSDLNSHVTEPLSSSAGSS